MLPYQVLVQDLGQRPLPYVHCVHGVKHAQHALAGTESCTHACNPGFSHIAFLGQLLTAAKPSISPSLREDSWAKSWISAPLCPHCLRVSSWAWRMRRTKATRHLHTSSLITRVTPSSQLPRLGRSTSTAGVLQPADFGIIKVGQLCRMRGRIAIPV